MPEIHHIVNMNKAIQGSCVPYFKFRCQNLISITVASCLDVVLAAQ